MILLFSVQLGWLPASGYVSPFEDLRANLAAMIMPAFVLGNAIAAVLMRHTRSAMLQVLSSDYVRTARAKGLSERAVVLKHALRNALMPVITLGALEFGTLLSGAVLTEQVFTIPGFGKLIVDAVFNRDYAVVQGVVLVTATAYIVLEPARRPRLLRGQPAAARLMAAVLAARCRRRRRRRRARSPRRRRGAAPGASSGAGAARCSASSSSRCFVVARAVRAVDRAVRSDRDELERDPQGADRGALVRHRRDRPRRVLARDLGHARVAARRRRRRSRSRCCSACRSA